MNLEPMKHLAGANLVLTTSHHSIFGFQSFPSPNENISGGLDSRCRRFDSACGKRRRSVLILGGFRSRVFGSEAVALILITLRIGLTAFVQTIQNTACRGPEISAPSRLLDPVAHTPLRSGTAVH